MSRFAYTLFPIIFSASGFCQTLQELAPLTEKVEVRAVNVDVTVTTSSGQPATRLLAEDFEVLEDGKPQTITGFYAIENSALQQTDPSKDLHSTTPRDFRRKVVLMIDNNSVPRPPRDAAIEFAGRFVDEDYSENFEWSVVAVSSTVETLQPFTTDKEQIRSALLAARRRPTYEHQRQIDRSLLSDPVRARLRDNEGASRYDFAASARFQSQEQTARNLVALKNTARAIIQTCRAYSAAAGKKSLILITGGIELNTGFSAFESDRDRKMREMRREAEQILNTMVREANTANFKIFIIKAGGHEPHVPQHEVSNRSAGLGGSAKNPFFGEGFTRSGDSRDVDSSSLTLALQTGGRYFPGTNIRQSLEQIDDELSNFYSLAYTPKTPEDGTYHHIAVKVKRPGFTAHHRDGYLAISSEQRIEQMLRAPLTFAKEKGALPIGIELGPPDWKEKGKPVIPITASLPMRSITLFPRGDNHVGRIHIYLTIYDEEGNNVGYHHQVQDLRTPSARFGETQNQPFRYTMRVGMKKGAYSLVVTLRDDLTGEIGTAFQDVRL